MSNCKRCGRKLKLLEGLTGYCRDCCAEGKIEWEKNKKQKSYCKICNEKRWFVDSSGVCKKCIKHEKMLEEFSSRYEYECKICKKKYKKVNNLFGLCPDCNSNLDSIRKKIHK